MALPVDAWNQSSSSSNRPRSSAGTATCCSSAPRKRRSRCRMVASKSSINVASGCGNIAWRASIATSTCYVLRHQLATVATARVRSPSHRLLGPSPTNATVSCRASSSSNPRGHRPCTLPRRRRGGAVSNVCTATRWSCRSRRAARSHLPATHEHRLLGPSSMGMRSASECRSTLPLRRVAPQQEGASHPSSDRSRQRCRERCRSERPCSLGGVLGGAVGIGSKREPAGKT